MDEKRGNLETPIKQKGESDLNVADGYLANLKRGNSMLQKSSKFCSIADLSIK
jgi:hypothetical protein